MFNFLNLFGNHEIDTWRDNYTLLAAATLNQVAVDLIASCEAELASATWKEGLVAQGSFIANRVTPKIHEIVRPIVDHMSSKANDALARIVEHQAIWQYKPIAFGEPAQTFDGWQDVALAAGPLAGGVAVAAALPTMAVTTSTAFFGLVTTSAISWPVVVGGGTVAGIVIATGLLNTGKIWDRAEARLRRKVREHVIATLLMGPQEEPSILEQLTEALADAAVRAKKL